MGLALGAKSMSRHYDVIVVGSGAAASAVASRVRAAGRSVALVDFRPWGGTCALRGCDPKKVLVAGTEAVRAAERLERRGVRGRVAIDWPALIGFKRTFTDPVPAERARGYRQAGIDAFPGRARFSDRRTLRVGDLELEATHIVLAAGAEPIPLGIPGEEHASSCRSRRCRSGSSSSAAATSRPSSPTSRRSPGRESPCCSAASGCSRLSIPTSSAG